MDWVAPTPERRAFMGFVFDGGVLTDASGIRLQSDELDEWAFVPRGELRERLTANTADRVEAALRARATGAVAYLRGGAPVRQSAARHSWRSSADADIGKDHLK
jgi:8-oxo-dGTP diphosphatase